MLKLIDAVDAKISSVKDYCSAFDNTVKDYNCYAFYLAKNSVESYYDYITSSNKNIYYLVDDEKTDYIIGYGSIDSTMDCHIGHYNLGNISYGVRPNERNKGYATIILNLLLIKCAELGMEEVCISCNKYNIASKKAIIKNGGKLEKTFFDEFEGEGLKFWIKLYPNKKRRK